jgi:hypothetical protein
MLPWKIAVAASLVGIVHRGRKAIVRRRVVHAGTIGVLVAAVKVVVKAEVVKEDPKAGRGAADDLSKGSRKSNWRS